jgi:hypothetical protein
MLKRSWILKILVCTRHNYGDGLSIEIAKKEFKKEVFFDTPFISGLNENKNLTSVSPKYDP